MLWKNRSGFSKGSDNCSSESRLLGDRESSSASQELILCTLGRFLGLMDFWVYIGILMRHVCDERY